MHVDDAVEDGEHFVAAVEYAFRQYDPGRLNCMWFARINTLFGEMILKLRAARTCATVRGDVREHNHQESREDQEARCILLSH